MRIYRSQTLLYFGVILFFLSINCSASFNDSSLVKLLPDKKLIKDWTPIGDAELAASDELYLLINGGAVIYQEYGFKSALHQTYKDKEGNTINVEIYKMEDPSAAYGIFTFKTGLNGKSIDIGAQGWLESYFLNFWKGSFQVTLTGFDSSETIISAIQMLAESIDSKINEQSTLPQIASFLPTEGLPENGITYLRGNIAMYNQYFFGDKTLKKNKFFF